MTGPVFDPPLSRRDLLARTGTGLGVLGLAATLGQGGERGGGAVGLGGGAPITRRRRRRSSTSF